MFAKQTGSGCDQNRIILVVLLAAVFENVGFDEEPLFCASTVSQSVS